MRRLLVQVRGTVVFRTRDATKQNICSSIVVNHVLITIHTWHVPSAAVVYHVVVNALGMLQSSSVGD